MRVEMKNHNIKIRNLFKRIYSEDLKESLIVNNDENSFQFENQENTIVATRKNINGIEKYTLDKFDENLNGEFIVLLDSNSKLIGTCKKNKLDGIQKIFKDNECILEINMVEGRIKNQDIFSKSQKKSENKIIEKKNILER